MSSTAVLSISSGFSAAVHISANVADHRRLTAVTKLLTILLIMSVALVGENSLSPVYRYFILAGLFFSLIGDAFLLSEHRFLHGLVAFLAAHVCYILAFTDRGFLIRLDILPVFIPGAVLFFYIRDNLGRLRWPVVLYMVVILVMVYEAFYRWRLYPTGPAYLAMSGAFLFAVSDSLLAVNRFGKPYRFAQVSIMSTYYVAQWLIALSV